MTRERLEQIVRDESWEARVKAVHKAYDDFESRTCDNCKYLVSDDYELYCSKDITTFGDDMNWIDSIDTFGCNKFERKDEES
jgi:hypothetical protein